MEKTKKTLFTLQELTSAPRVDVTGERDVSGMEEAAIFIRLGRTVTTGFTAGVEFRIEGSPDESGNFWVSIPATVVSALGSSVGEEAVSGTCAAEQNVIGMASTTGFVVGDIVFIENTTMANSEFGRIKAVSANTSVTLEDDLENAQTGSTVRDQVELWSLMVDVRAMKRIRSVVDGSGAAQNFAAEIAMVEMR